MRYSVLGSSNIEVSRVCLGSMTWGYQNNQEDADEQIEYALSKGVNFIDTAEMYAVPPSEETYGATEKIIGNWLANNQNRRKDLIIATKIAGSGLSWIRGGGPITGEAVITAVESSLQRLQTDYIDLYQLHWPNRTTPHFGKHHVGAIQFSDTNQQAQEAQMLEILQALKICIDAGKIRFCGLSNETSWGLNQYLKLSEKHNLPNMVSIQNEFNLLHTKDWPHLMENCALEDVAYLPWSPLGGGMLSGKYLNGARPEGSRWTINQRLGLFRDTEQSSNAIAAYQKIAEEANLTTAQLALAWCDSVPGVTSTIIGATTMAQLEEDIDAFNSQISDETLRKTQEALSRYTSPF